MIQILKHTPVWVWFIFVALVILGYLQSRDRCIGTTRLFMLPVAMMLFAVYGVTSAFGFSLLALILWGIGFALPLAFVSFLTPKGISVTPDGFHIPGSRIPFTLMMAIFVLKYILGVVSARHLPVIANPCFAGIISFSLGILSGIFLARNIGIMRGR